MYGIYNVERLKWRIQIHSANKYYSFRFVSFRFAFLFALLFFWCWNKSYSCCSFISFLVRNFFLAFFVSVCDFHSFRLKIGAISIILNILLVDTYKCDIRTFLFSFCIDYYYTRQKQASLKSVWCLKMSWCAHQITKSISYVQWFWDHFSPFYVDANCMYVCILHTIPPSLVQNIINKHCSLSVQPFQLISTHFDFIALARLTFFYSFHF